MKGKVIINNQEIEIEINEEQLEQLKIKKKTGYERVEQDEEYYYDNGTKDGDSYHEDFDCCDDRYYESANYYNNKQLMLNNLRVDRLMRQLRRFAVENRKEKLDWNSNSQEKIGIHMDYDKKDIVINFSWQCRQPGAIYFDSQAIANAAIVKFKDELIWYFTEYKDSL